MKPNLKGHQHKVFVLDFFGTQKLPNAYQDFDISSNKILTAFGSPWNPFLGFFISRSAVHSNVGVTKKLQGVIWGKDPKHYRGSVNVLRQIADIIPLHSTASSPVFSHPNIQWHGHLASGEWLKLLAESKFLIGLGDPLLGPSAIDAIAMGCVYINPIYKTNVRNIHLSQHEYARNKIGPPRVCSAPINDAQGLLECSKMALATDLTMYIPPDFEYENFLSRVRSIFISGADI